MKRTLAVAGSGLGAMQETSADWGSCRDTFAMDGETKSPTRSVYTDVSEDACEMDPATTPTREKDDLAAANDSIRSAFCALVAGDLDALATLYDLCVDLLFGVALWRTGSPEDAADAVQDVFVRLTRFRKQLGEVRDPRAYLLRMTHSAAIDLLRKRHKTAPVDGLMIEAEPSQTDREVDATRISRLLHSLPPEQREVLYLRHFGELSFAEIAKATRVPTFTAATRYRLGICRIRKILGVNQ